MKPATTYEEQKKIFHSIFEVEALNSFADYLGGKDKIQTKDILEIEKKYNIQIQDYLDGYAIKIGETQIIPCPASWIHAKNAKGQIKDHSNNWDKYMIFSKNYVLLISIMIKEVNYGNFRAGKVPSLLNKENSKYGKYVLCLYAEKNKEVENHLKNTCSKFKELIFVGHKHYTEQEIKERKLNETRN